MSVEEKREADSAFVEVIGELGTCEPEEARKLVTWLQEEKRLAALGKRERRKFGEAAFVEYAWKALADDRLTEDEENTLAAIAEAFGLNLGAFERDDLRLSLQIAKLNDGRLPVAECTSLTPRPGEIVHLETSAALLKEVAVFEWRPGSQGVRFRTMKGVRYGLVMVGTQQQTNDTGLLVVTSQRVAFLGERKKIDLPYSELTEMRQDTNTLSFSRADRRISPRISVAMSTEVLAALISAASREAHRHAVSSDALAATAG